MNLRDHAQVTLETARAAMAADDVQIGKARELLRSQCDGPITPFVLISRATRLSAEKTFPDHIMADALHQELLEFGWIIADDDALVETGS